MFTRTLMPIALLLALVPALLTGSNASADTWRDTYPQFVLGIVTGENARDARLRWEPMRDYLAQQLATPVVLRQATDYAGIIEAHAAGKVDVAWYSGASYATAFDVLEGDLEPIAMDVSLKGKLGYHSVIIVAADSPAQSLDDLRGKRLAFADPNSTSGYMIPNHYLRKMGKLGDGIEFFESTSFSGKHEHSVLAVNNGVYDAAATWMYDEHEGVLTRMAANNMIEVRDFRIIWMSPLIPNSPFALRKSMPSALKEKFKTVILEFPERDPERFAKVGKDFFSRFAPATHAMYEYAIALRKEQIRQR